MRNYDKEGNQEPTTAARMPASALSNYAHAVIFVVKGDDPCLMDGTYRDKLQKIRETFCHEGNNNIYPIHLTAPSLHAVTFVVTWTNDLRIFFKMKQIPSPQCTIQNTMSVITYYRISLL